MALNLKALVAVGVGVAIALSGCAAQAAHAGGPPVPVRSSGRVTFANEGDSISAFFDNNRNVIPWSWVRNAINDGDLGYIGGYARAGATTAELLQYARPTVADVTVIMAGTNDVTQGVPTSATLNRIAAMFATMGGAHKILSAVAPRTDDIQQANALNYWLARLAKQHHWTFIDPWVSVRNADGSWKAGTNTDHVHPSPATGVLVGKIMHDEILKVGGK